jgi:spore germination protein YaaH
VPGVAAETTSPSDRDGAGPSATVVAPVPGHELYGFVPYWEMDAGIAAHLRETPLTTLALFSVTHTSKGALNTKQQGHRRITGDIGQRLVREAHERGTRVEIVYTSFGSERNRRLFERPDLQDAVIESLVALVERVDADGINVDVEVLDLPLVPAFGDFVGRLRDAVRAADPDGQVSVATGAGPLGAGMAVAAAQAGADRIFLMGYDYRVAASAPGASAPLDRSDGGERSLRWSLDLYDALGVPRDRLLLGLPLYGMTWPVVGPVIGAPETGRGDAWIPRRNTDLLRDAAAVPVRDEVEQVDVYFIGSDGSLAAPTPGASVAAGDLDRTWTAVYVDSPETLAPKMTLANERGLAGSGFWAVGYERGRPGYRDLMERFVAGESP